MKLKQFQQRLTENIQPLLIQESLMTNAFFQQLLIARHLTCELVIKKENFKDYEHFVQFYQGLLKYEKRLNQHYVHYCQENELDELAREYCIKIKGFYVSTADFAKAEKDHNMLMIYVDLTTSNNRRNLSSLYHWEEKLHELRTDSGSTGLQAVREEYVDDDELPF